MVSRQATQITRLAALAALAGSALLLLHYLQPDPRHCGFNTNCGRVLFSRFGRILVIPLPVVGVLTFGALFALSLFPARCAGRSFQLIALGAGGIGLGLILIQVFVIGQLCPYCLVVDLSALLVAAVECGLRRGKPLPGLSLGGRCAWLLAATISLAAVAVLGLLGDARAGAQRRPVPPQISALWVPGKVTVVEIADFRCAHCRRLNAVLTQFLRVEPDRVHFVRLTVPMPDHPESRHASRACVCAAAQGKGDVVAEALFASPELTPEACEQLAALAGVSLPAYRACVRDPATNRHLDADVAWTMAAISEGLPVVWVQDRMLLGEQSYGAIREAVDEAERRLRDPAP